MQEGNLDRLKANKEATIFHLNVIAALEPLSFSMQARRSKLFDLVKDAYNKGDYSAAMDYLEERRDAALGITWYRSSPHTDGSVDLIRDARLAGTTPPPMDSQDSYAIQYLNHARTAIKLLDQEVERFKQVEFDTDKRQEVESRIRFAKNIINERMGEVLKDLNSEKPIDIKALNTDLLEIMKATGINDAHKRIATAIDFSNLSDRQYIMSVQTVIESDTMLLGLTDIQKAQYLAIHQARPGIDIDLKFGSPAQKIDMNWYNNQPRYIRDLIKEHALGIAEGKVIPTQLRNHLIGLKNAYAKDTYVLDAEEKSVGANSLVASTLHSGTISTHIKGIDGKAKQAITDENAQQINSFVDSDDKKMVINVLNSPVNPTGIDGDIGKQVEGVEKSGLKARFANAITPLNMFRLLKRYENTGFSEPLARVGDFMQNNFELKNLAKFLQTGKNQTETRKDLEELAKLNPDLAK
ncbi:hypothetical protein RFI_12351, partial [Reticulomyxa filosa]